MPELPDIELYLYALRPRVIGQILEDIRVRSPSLLRSVDPPLGIFHGLRIVALRRLGKRIVFEFEGELFLVLHLMVSGRLALRPPGAGIRQKHVLAAFDLADTTILLTERATKKRAALWPVRGEFALAAHNPGGLEIATTDLSSFAQRLRSKSHTLKRSLSDPRLFSGIGNAYSDEILHRAKLSPFALSGRLTESEVERLFLACGAVLDEWTARLQAAAGDMFPEKVTAFRPEMAVHGKYGDACPVCDTPVQRIRYASNETNYCPGCQTEGRILADRSLSRLLGKDWPRSLDALEELESRYRDET